MIDRILLEYKKNIFWNELNESDKEETKWQTFKHNAMFMPEYTVLGIIMIIFEVIALALLILSRINAYSILQLAVISYLLLTIIISNKVRAQQITDHQYERTYSYALVLKEYLGKEYKISDKDDYRLILSSVHDMRTAESDVYLATQPCITVLIALVSAFLGGMYGKANDTKEISLIFFLSLAVTIIFIGIGFFIFGMKKASKNRIAMLSLENALLILSVGVERYSQSPKYHNCKQRYKQQKKAISKKIQKKNQRRT